MRILLLLTLFSLFTTLPPETVVTCLLTRPCGETFYQVPLHVSLYVKHVYQHKENYHPGGATREGDTIPMVVKVLVGRRNGSEPSCQIQLLNRDLKRVTVKNNGLLVKKDDRHGVVKLSRGKDVHV